MICYTKVHDTSIILIQSYVVVHLSVILRNTAEVATEIDRSWGRFSYPVPGHPNSPRLIESQQHAGTAFIASLVSTTHTTPPRLRKIAPCQFHFSRVSSPNHLYHPLPSRRRHTSTVVAVSEQRGAIMRLWPRSRVARVCIQREKTGNEVSAVIFLEQSVQQGRRRIAAQPFVTPRLVETRNDTIVRRRTGEKTRVDPVPFAKHILPPNRLAVSE